MAEPLIRTSGLCKSYRTGTSEVDALRGIYLDIDRAEFVAVMGPSGSGKSTLMNLLGLLDRPSGGNYFLEGRNVGCVDDDECASLRNGKIGFVFQTFNLLTRSSALENVELPLIYAGMRKAERRRRAARALETIGLGHRLNHWPHQLSGGEQQRVAIARALVNDPLLILADEPTGALDSRTGLEIMALFQAANRAGRTVIVVTHDPNVARHATRIISIRDGRAVGDDGVARPVDADIELGQSRAFPTDVVLQRAAMSG